jgi:hypothetical protein
MTALSYVTRVNLKVRLNIGTADTTDDALLDDIVEQVNAYVEHVAHRPLGPSNGGTATFDAEEDVYPDGALYVRQGIRSVTSATVAPATGQAGVAATVADIVVLPRSQNRRPDWPGEWLVFKDVVTGSVSDWGSGYANITVVGDFGWAAIPPEVVEVAEIVATRAWYARQTGQADIVGSDETGAPLVSRFLSLRDRDTLRAFQPDRLAVG